MHREGGEQLGPVDGLHPRRRRVLAEAEVDEHRPAVGHQHVRGPQRPVGETAAVQGLHRRPDGVEQLGVDRLGRQLVEPRPGDVFEGERHRAVGRGG